MVTLTNQGVMFGDRWFSAPAPLPGIAFPGLRAQAGLYVVMVYDPQWGPRPFRPLYFGESDDIWNRCTAVHERFAAWRRAAGPSAVLYRALSPMPGATRAQRQAAESALIARYAPPCNERLSMSLAALLSGRR